MVMTKLVTAEDLALPIEDECRYDLIRGELYRMAPAGARHGKIGMRIARPLANHVSEHELGEVFGAETGFILARDPDTMLAPDVAFVRADRLPPDEEQDGFLPLAPDLVVEIVSPSDTARYVFDKVMEYLDAGVLMVIVIEPRRRTVSVYGSDRVARVLVEGEELDGGDVLPGFRLPVKDLFR